RSASPQVLTRRRIPPVPIEVAVDHTVVPYVDTVLTQGLEEALHPVVGGAGIGRTGQDGEVLVTEVDQVRGQVETGRVVAQGDRVEGQPLLADGDHLTALALVLGEFVDQASVPDTGRQGTPTRKDDGLGPLGP